ncbi:MAG: cytochrome-c oxidase, partial [Acidobacteria bacterium]|nr:cytochrome-c oxidase [Acidobacteriota bacterium]MDW7985179.1 cytochrome-c oxidase [Acidobacteriota bacterium]
LPEFRVKQDAVPGMTISVWFTPRMTGTFEIACNHICGLGHYRMRGFLYVEEASQFEQWLAEQAPFVGE